MKDYEKQKLPKRIEELANLKFGRRGWDRLEPAES
jgi:hypothetical protein